MMRALAPDSIDVFNDNLLLSSLERTENHLDEEHKTGPMIPTLVIILLFGIQTKRGGKVPMDFVPSSNGTKGGGTTARRRHSSNHGIRAFVVSVAIVSGHLIVVVVPLFGEFCHCERALAKPLPRRDRVGTSFRSILVPTVEGELCCGPTTLLLLFGTMVCMARHGVGVAVVVVVVVDGGDTRERGQ